VSKKRQKGERNCFPIKAFKQKMPGCLRHNRCSNLLLWPTRSDGYRMLFVQATSCFPFQSLKRRCSRILLALHKPVFQN